MNEQASSAAVPGMGRVIGGIVFIIGWVLVHVVLFYLFFVSGILVDIFVSFVRAIMFPGSPHYSSVGHEIFGWAGTLQAGLIIAGASGVPAGLSFFWSRWRRVLRIGFWSMFTAGLACELYAAYTILSNALTVPS